MPRSRLIAACAALAVGFATYTAWLTAGWGGEPTVRVVSDFGSLLAGAVTMAWCAATARTHHGRARWAWLTMTLAVFGWFCGDAVWAGHEMASGGQAPFPSIADACYLTFPLAATAALILLPVGSVGLSQARLLLDALTVAGSLFVIFWALGLDGVIRQDGAPTLGLAVSVAYPVADIVLMTTATLLLTRALPGQRFVVAVFAVAAATMALSDAVFVLQEADDEYTTGSVTDVGWLAGLLLLAVAAMLGYRSGAFTLGSARPPSRLASSLPYVFLPVATVFVVTGDGSTVVLATSLSVVFAVLTRQYLVAEENRRLMQTIVEQALRDPLTGLANRALFRDRLTHALAMHQRDGHDVAVLSIDLDDFKLVNDSLGHPAGDALLGAIAVRIVGATNATDTVARVGGDEFAVLVEFGADRALEVAHRIFDGFDEPFVIEGHDVFMRPSVGVAVAHVDGDAEAGADLVLKHADLAMYAAKRSQHGGVAPFTADMELIDPREVAPAQDRPALPAPRSGTAGLQLFAQLRRAIDGGDLGVVYQPKFAVRTGAVVGVEALVRWEHPDRGLLMPADFLPLARQNGLMGALTEAVVDRAVRDAVAWRTAGRDVPVAVNLFPPSLVDVELPNRIVGVFAEHALPTAFLTVEITEDFLLGNTQRARAVLDMLRGSGIRIAIDDFGSGYSALSYLRELPIDELKLDRQFIAPILTDDHAEAIVCTIIDLAHRLEMTCVAEGVEDAATAQRLAARGCDVLQGYFCSRPVTADRVLDVRPLPPRGDPATAAGRR